jgi:hypothetical protein
MKYLLYGKLFELFELFDKKVRNYSLFDKFLNPYLNPSLAVPRPVFFRKKIRIFRKILFFEFFKKWPPKNSKHSKKNYLIFDTIWLQFG